jgi:hypothetical protein
MRNDAGMRCVVAREAIFARLDGERPQVLAQQVGAMRDVLLAHREPGTPVVIGRNVSGARRGGPGGAAGRSQPRRGRHALPADCGVVANPVVLRRFRRPGVPPAALDFGLPDRLAA